MSLTQYATDDVGCAAQVFGGHFGEPEILKFLFGFQFDQVLYARTGCGDFSGIGVDYGIDHERGFLFRKLFQHSSLLIHLDEEIVRD
jgi:hypothetical protein